MSTEKNFEEVELNKEDLEWIDTSLKIAREMVEFYLKVKPEYYYEPELLDKVFVECLKDLDNKMIQPNVVVAALGSAMGQCLIDRLGFKWIIYKDDQGTDLALKHPVSGWISYPMSSVYTRLETKERGFVKGIFDTFKNEMGKE
jgi:hypothetical protein